MFPGFPNSAPSSVPRNPAPQPERQGPWFRDAPFNPGGPAADPAQGSRGYWLPQQYNPASRPHYPSEGYSPDWWFGHSGSGLQYVPPSFPESYPERPPAPQQFCPEPHRPMPSCRMALVPDAPQQYGACRPSYASYDAIRQPFTQHTQETPVETAQYRGERATYNPPQPFRDTGEANARSESARAWEPAPPPQPPFVPPTAPKEPQAATRAVEREASAGAETTEAVAEREPGKKSKGKRKREEAKKRKDVPPDPLKRLQRKNIREIKDDKELDVVTINAQKEEQERMRRLQEARLRALERAREGRTQPAGPIALGSSSGDDETTSESSEEEEDAERSAFETEGVATRVPQDVIDISSDEGKVPEEDDDVVMVVSDEEDGAERNEAEDESHTNDAVNLPDEFGRVLVNVGHPPEDPDVFLAPQLARAVKPHQIGGIRFLFDNVVESLDRFDTSSGFGCILAHSMGLGKTLQVISFVDVLLRHTAARKVLCITPINTIQNWMAEFDKWVPAPEAAANCGGAVRPRSYGVYVLNDLYRTTATRAELILEWHEKGGVLLMGYEMYRTLALKKAAKPGKRRRSPRKEDTPEDEAQNSRLLEDVYGALVNPGPDLVICDEGHRIKNCNASTSAALKSIRTRRRVVLTGYPLQNNLLEYWCMVDFVRPSYLGTRSEFCNMFERPIQNGQCLDSTPKDRQLMRFRAHVLHSLLQGFVQRRGHAVLRDVLPRKEEHVLLIRMTPIQRTLYKEFVKEFLHNYRVANPLKFFAVCCKVWNHPDILYNLVQDKKSEGVLDIDLDIDLAGPTARDCKKVPAAGPVDPVEGPLMDGFADGGSTSREGVSPLETTAVPRTPRYLQEPGFTPFRDRSSDNTISYEWAYPLLENYVPGLLENSHKFQVLMTMIEHILGVGDKLLVFSQSLSTLDLVERFLGRRELPPRPGLPHGEKWTRGRNYFRLDGSTSAQEREKLINEYNANPLVSLFLLSTRAGCLGINLTGANRIVVLDASWNPCHDAQAVCRIYRYGQTKPCHIYRLVCDNCLEKRIYDRQVNKQGMSDRVVDEMNPEANLTWKDVSTLVQDNEDDPPVQALAGDGFTDSVLRTLALHYPHCLTKEPFEHESLLLDRKDMKLTKFEKRLARQSYELAKRATLQGGRTLHAGAYAVQGNGYQTWQNRQSGVTFVGPTKMTPSPMRPLDGNVMQALLRQGMTVQRMRIPAKVTIPLKDSDDPPVEIAPGTEILVMKTPRGVFLQVPDGRIIAVRIPTGGAEAAPSAAAGGQTGEGTSGGTTAGNDQSFGVVQPSLQCGGRVQLSSAQKGGGKPPEVINLDDDSDAPEVSDEDDGTSTPPAAREGEPVGDAVPTPSL